MRTLIAALIALTACGSGKTSVPEVAVHGTERVPRVVEDSVLVVDGALAVPPLLVIVDTAGELHIGAAKTWDELATADPLARAKVAHAAPLDLAVREAAERKLTPQRALELYDDTRRTPPPAEDPPPPPAEDDPDPVEESGGTRAMIEFDEGKMGKKDSDRAEGSYRMQRDVPQRPPGPNANISGGPGLVRSLPPSNEEDPRRLAVVAGQIIGDNRVAPEQRALVLADPAAKALMLAGAIQLTRGLIAVGHGGRVRPLRLDFASPDDDRAEAAAWIELRIGANDVGVEAVPDVPARLSTLDPKALAAALGKARTARGRDPEEPVDVLIEPDVSAQRLVDVLVALDLAGVRTIGLGAMPAAGSAEALHRGHHDPKVQIGRPVVNGDLAKTEIRKVIRAQRATFLACYVRELATQPALQGSVYLQFFIAPTGKVLASSASGLTPGIADCIAKIIKTAVFPTPKGGGGVQVNYPFTFRP